MHIDLIIAFVAFAFVASATPGPNNLMLMASGANFGFRRTVPHMLGISFGFTVMVVLVGIGLIQVFERYPLVHVGLRVVSVVYLLYLAWRIANAVAPEDARRAGKPLSFIGAALFQWVNPKAWAMALTAITAYTPEQTLATVVFIAVLFGAINLPSVSLWTMAGEKLRLILTNPVHLRWFNYLMAAALVLSLWPVLMT